MTAPELRAGLEPLTDFRLVQACAALDAEGAEAVGADIDDLDFERGHRTLKIVR